MYKIYYLNKRKIISFNIKILKMNSKFCKKSIVQFTLFSFFITKWYTIFYYLHYFLLFPKFTYYFVWRNLPTNSNYFTKIYLLFSVTLIIIYKVSDMQLILLLIQQIWDFTKLFSANNSRFIQHGLDKSNIRFNRMTFRH